MASTHRPLLGTRAPPPLSPPPSPPPPRETACAQRTRHIRGLMSAVIVLLLQYGWDPISPPHWHLPSDESGSEDIEWTFQIRTFLALKTSLSSLTISRGPYNGISGVRLRRITVVKEHQMALTIILTEFSFSRLQTLLMDMSSRSLCWRSLSEAHGLVNGSWQKFRKERTTCECARDATRTESCMWRRSFSDVGRVRTTRTSVPVSNQIAVFQKRWFSTSNVPSSGFEGFYPMHGQRPRHQSKTHGGSSTTTLCLVSEP
ncbi:unnamed protein product [Prorocentrum cordatum]|uniref:Uncharacterized protein n=1 Tax=Prorocentrum cordatum TaxID=2364126 RepID=A0ABN9URW4_9DINO|nr:unnamed protein product [Polarella glacialis]